MMPVEARSGCHVLQTQAAAAGRLKGAGHRACAVWAERIEGHEGVASRVEWKPQPPAFAAPASPSAVHLAPLPKLAPTGLDEGQNSQPARA